MFTGIISAIGKIVSLEQRQGDVRITIDAANLGLDGSGLTFMPFFSSKRFLE